MKIGILETGRPPGVLVDQFGDYAAMFGNMLGEEFEIDRFDVPGSFELPLIAKYAAQSGRYGAVVCLGAVIRGETDHYDYVCAETARGIQSVQLETGIPCGFGVLTVDTIEQALARVKGGDKRDSGAHAVEAVLAVLKVKDELGGRRARAGFSV